MTNSQKKTIEIYQKLVHANAMTQTYMLARKLGIFEQLVEGQKTAEQIAQDLDLANHPTMLLLDQLCETGFVEKYGDDYALSVLGQMLPAELSDLGNRYWSQLENWVRNENRIEDANTLIDETDYGLESMAFEWMATPNALDLIEILNVGKSRKGMRVIELACGSAVFSSAMAYHDPEMKICLVDNASNLEKARKTTVSIQVDPRCQYAEADPVVFESNFQADLVLIANRLPQFDEAGLKKILKNAAGLLNKKGEIVIIDEFCETSDVMFSHRTHAILTELRTPRGQQTSRKKMTDLLHECGFVDVMYSDLKSPPATKGVIVAGLN